jgi:hypothetical protein
MGRGKNISIEIMPVLHLKSGLLVLPFRSRLLRTMALALYRLK